MEEPWKAALIQMDSGCDKKENMRKAEYFIRQAAGEGACLAVFPETVDYIGTDMRAHAEEIPGAWGNFSPFRRKNTGCISMGEALQKETRQEGPLTPV